MQGVSEYFKLLVWIYATKTVTPVSLEFSTHAIHLSWNHFLLQKGIHKRTIVLSYVIFHSARESPEMYSIWDGKLKVFSWQRYTWKSKSFLVIFHLAIVLSFNMNTSRILLGGINYYFQPLSFYAELSNMSLWPSGGLKVVEVMQQFATCGDVVAL